MLWDRVIQSASTIKIERVRKNETVTLGENESYSQRVPTYVNESAYLTVTLGKIESAIQTVTRAGIESC